MDPLSITTAVVACLQTSFSILSWCYSIRKDMRTLPCTLIQIIEEVRDLRNLIETIEPILDGKQDSEKAEQDISNKLCNTIKPVMVNCLFELQALEGRIRPEQVEAVLQSKTKAFFQSLTWRLKGNEAKESITNLQRCKASLNLVMSSHNSLVVRNIQRLSLSIDDRAKESSQRLLNLARDFKTSKLDEQQESIINWLSPLKPGQNHLQVKSAHQPGTSVWFHESKKFREWYDGKNAMLWLSGPSGSGKTVMMSQAIESVASRICQGDKMAAYAYVYCDFRDPDTQSLTSIFGSLLGQLCTETKYFPVQLLDAYKSSTEQNGGCGPTIEMMSEVFGVLSMKRKIHLLIDAIDEARDYKQLAKRVVSLTRSSAYINALVTSRNEVNIQRIFADIPRVSLEGHISEIDDDIERYIATWLENDEDLEWLSPEVQSLVSTSLLSKSKGSFRWVTCQLESLKHCRTVRNIRKTLSKLPEGLNETYGRLLLRTSPSELPLVRKIMTWLSFASVPIKLHELWEALAIETGRKDIDDESRLRSPQDILILGNSLITVSQEGYVMLAHLSVQDYLLSDEIRQNPETAKFALEPKGCHLELAQDCLTYLFFSHLSSGPSGTQDKYLCRLRQLPLIQYASRYWFYHANNAENNEDLHELCFDFFHPKARGNFMAWVQVFNATSPFKWDIFPRHATALYYASSLGLGRVVDGLVESATIGQLNAPGSRFGGTPIHAAAIREHLSVIQQLVVAGANPGKADFNGVTPLHSAAGQGSLEVVKILLESGAPREARDGMEGKTPVEWARISGYLSAAELIEQYSGIIQPTEESRCSTDKKSVDNMRGEEESKVAEVWQPRVGYFPDYYERRSGLDSSCIVSMTVGGETSVVDCSVILLQDEALSPVW